MLTGIMAYGQCISFGTWAGSNISIHAVTVNMLNFGNLIKGKPIPNSVRLSEATSFEITAPEGYGLTVRIDAPLTLNGPDSKTIPFNLKFAYSNQGLVESQARRNTVEVTAGSNTVTFPVMRNAMGLPATTPTTLDVPNTNRPTGKAYLYIYGSAGPPGAEAVAGEYAGTVNISVEYTSY